MKDADIAALKLEHPGRELILLSSPFGEVVAKAAGLVEVNELRARMADKKTAVGAVDWFVRSCIVFPSRDALNEMVQRKPFLVERWYQKLEAEAGAAEEIEVKKL